MNESRSARLRKRIQSDLPVQIPGAFNALCARAIEKAGFEAVYISGAGLSNAVHGIPDVGLVTLSEAVEHARRIVSAVGVPVISDADTGFGEAVNAARTVMDMEAAGVSAIHLEDQVLPKKCGHLDGKVLIPAEDMAEKIRAACAARRDPDFMIIARTDARGVTSFQDAVDRAQCYIDAGADAIFPEALPDIDEMAAFAGRISVPLLANMTEFGKTPLFTLAELQELGYRLVIYPQSALRAAFATVTSLLADLKKNGDQTSWIDRMQTRKDLYELLDYDGLEQIDRAATAPQQA